MLSLKSAISHIAAAGITALALSTVARAEANCDWYAKTSLQQQQENEQKKCGFAGPTWSADLKAHMTWCTTTNPDLWKAEAQKRQQMLVTCKK